MRFYPCDYLKLRIMQEGSRFIIEQDCGTSGWWSIAAHFHSLTDAKDAVERLKKSYDDEKDRKQVWP